MSTYCIVLADDHVLIRQGLKKILEEKTDLAVVGEADDGLKLLDLLDVLSPHMVILDISMPNLRGLEAAHEIKKVHPDVKILILTMHKDEEFFYEALSAGVDGYLLKENADTELFSAIERIREGGKYVSPSLSETLADQWAMMVRGEGRRSFQTDGLSLREREVLKLVAEGKSNKEVGELLSISARTVEQHRENLMDKLNLKKPTDLARYAVRKGYI